MKFKNDCHRCFAALSIQTRVEIVKLLQVDKRLNVVDMGLIYDIKIKDGKVVIIMT